MEVRNAQLSFGQLAGLLTVFFLIMMERIAWDFGPNTELVTMGMVLVAGYLGSRWSLTFTLAVLVISDLVLGNTNIFLFTWSGFLLPLILWRGNLSRAPLPKPLLAGLGFGLGANLFFYVWTNFGVWLLEDKGMYPDTALGLLQSYVAGLPFLKYQLQSTLAFVPLGILLTKLAISSIKTIKKTSAANWLFQ